MQSGGARVVPMTGKLMKFFDTSRAEAQETPARRLSPAPAGLRTVSRMTKWGLAVAGTVGEPRDTKSFPEEIP
jgi:hypothetical protein